MLFKRRSKVPERRRNYTSQSSTSRGKAVFSYHASRSVRQGSMSREAQSEGPSSAASNRIKRLTWHGRIPAISLLLTIAVFLIFCLRLSSSPKVILVGTEKSQAFLRETAAYQAAATDAFASPLNRNKLTVDTDKITRDLKQRFPELGVISVTLPVLGTQPNIYMQPVAPKLVLVSKQGMFVLDNKGRALITGNQVHRLDEADIPIVGDESNVPIEVGQIALPATTVDFITEVNEQLKAKNLKVASLILPAGTSELHVRLQGIKYFVKFNLYGHAREEVGTYLAVKSRLDAERKIPAEYVDVRVENKAYYK